MRRSTRFRSSVRMSAVTVGLVALTVSACVQPDPPGLTLSKLEAKLVFGIDETPDEPLTPTEASQRFAGGGRPGLFVGSTTPRVRPYLPPAAPDVDACPPPKNAASPKFGATDNVNTNDEPGKPKNRPVEGVYPWRVLSSFGEGKDLEYDRLTPEGFELRAIRNVKEVPPSQWPSNPVAPTTRQVFTYEEVRNLSYYELETTPQGRVERLVEQFMIITYMVDTAGLRARPSQTDLLLSVPSNGDPERGIVLKKTVIVDGRGAPVQGVDSFEPPRGLLLMTLPFVPGESFAASATDSSHGTTVTHQTLVSSRDRMNMCGELMEGFPTTTTQTISSNNSSSPSHVYDVNTWFAPQHGGIPIYESTYTRATGSRVVYHRASLFPTAPLPADGLPR